MSQPEQISQTPKMEAVRDSETSQQREKSPQEYLSNQYPPLKPKISHFRCRLVLKKMGKIGIVCFHILESNEN
jgi:hypothetical protein